MMFCCLCVLLRCCLVCCVCARVLKGATLSDLPLAKRRKKAEEETTPGGEDAQENEASGDEGDGQLIEGAMVVDD